MPTQQPEFFESDGVRVRYLVRGEGTPVVLLHGFATSIELNWSMGLLDALASSYRVIAIDLRGHGLSDKPRDPEAYGVRFVDDVTNLLDYLDIERAHLVGYSMGAAITAKLLVTHPQRVLSAVLGGGGPQEPGERPAWRTTWLAGMERAPAEGSSVIDVLPMPDWPTLDPAIEAAVNRNDPAALAAILRGDESLSVGNAELRANTVPVLALIGTEDVTARPAVERMEQVMANLEVIRIPTVSNGGALDVRTLNAEQVTASVEQGGGIFTMPSRQLDASVTQGGAITYWGEPTVRSNVEQGGVVARGRNEDAARPLREFGPALPPPPPVPPVPPVPPALHRLD